MIRAIRSRGGTAALLLSLVVLGGAVGCSGPSSGTTTATTQPAPSTAAAPPATGAAPLSACADIAAKGNDVAAAVVQFIGGKVPPAQVADAIQELQNSVAAAKASSNGEAAERLTAVQTAFDQLKAALQAQPVDVGTVRAASQQTLTALRGLDAVCGTSASATPSVTATS